MLEKFLISICLSVLVLCGCASSQIEAQPQKTQRIASDAHSQIVGYDYSEHISTNTFFTFDTPGSELSGFNRVYLSQMEKKVTGELTEADKARLGIWNLESGRQVILAGTIYQVCTYFREHGVLPQNGLDLFPELFNGKAPSVLSTMETSQVLDSFADGIDPITGQFYRSFESENWVPGALHIKVITDPTLIRELYPKRDLNYGGYKMNNGQFVKPSSGSIDMVVTVTVYGEVEGTVIAEMTSLRGGG